MADKPKTYQSKEYWLIIAIVASDVAITNIDCKQDEKGQNYLLWTFPETEVVLDLEARYNTNKPIMLDLHKVHAAAELFKRNLQYYRIRG